MADPADFGALSAAQRKQQLMAQSALYRAEISNGKEAITAGLSAESVIQSVFSHLGTAALAAIRSRGGIGGISSIDGASLPAIAPLAMRAIGMLASRRLLKPVLRGVIIAGVVATIVSVIAARKKSRDTSAARSIDTDRLS